MVQFLSNSESLLHAMDLKDIDILEAPQSYGPVLVERGGGKISGLNNGDGDAWFGAKMLGLTLSKDLRMLNNRQMVSTIS